jgi:hypothetical protein
MPGFSVVVTLLAGAGAWSARHLGGVAVGAGGLIGAGLFVAGRALGPGFLVPLGLVVAAVFLGALLGRLIPPGPGPMGFVLAALAVADIWWISSGGGTGEGLLGDLANVSVSLGSTTSTIGTVDVVLAAAVSTHRSVRGGTLWPAVLAAPIGMALANVYVIVTGADNLPLIPFIAIGWLVTEPWHRRRQTPRSASVG